MSLGSMELVVFMLQVKRSERGLASLFSSFCSEDTLRLEPSYLPFLSYSVGSLLINLNDMFLLVSLEVNLLKRLVEPRLRVWDSGVASWDKLGEAGGPLYVAVRRSRGWPWKVLRLAVPLGKRMRSGVVALLILWVEATGVLGSGTVLFSLPFWITECLSAAHLSLQT